MANVFWERVPGGIEPLHPQGLPVPQEVAGAVQIFCTACWKWVSKPNRARHVARGDHQRALLVAEEPGIPDEAHEEPPANHGRRLEQQVERPRDHVIDEEPRNLANSIRIVDVATMKEWIPDERCTCGTRPEEGCAWTASGFSDVLLVTGHEEEVKFRTYRCNHGGRFNIFSERIYPVAVLDAEASPRKWATVLGSKGVKFAIFQCNARGSYMSTRGVECILREFMRSLSLLQTVQRLRCERIVVCEEVVKEVVLRAFAIHAPYDPVLLDEVWAAAEVWGQIGIDWTYQVARRVHVTRPVNKKIALSVKCSVATLMSNFGFVLKAVVTPEGEGARQLATLFHNAEPGSRRADVEQKIQDCTAVIYVDDIRKHERTLQQMFLPRDVRVAQDRFHFFHRLMKQATHGHADKKVLAVRLQQLGQMMATREVANWQALSAALKGLLEEFSKEKVVYEVRDENVEVALLHGVVAQEAEAIAIARSKCRTISPLLTESAVKYLQKQLEDEQLMRSLVVGDEEHLPPGTNVNESFHAMLKEKMYFMRAASWDLFQVVLQLVVAERNVGVLEKLLRSKKKENPNCLLIERHLQNFRLAVDYSNLAFASRMRQMKRVETTTAVLTPLGYNFDATRKKWGRVQQEVLEQAVGALDMEQVPPLDPALVGKKRRGEPHRVALHLCRAGGPFEEWAPMTVAGKITALYGSALNANAAPRVAVADAESEDSSGSEESSNDDDDDHSEQSEVSLDFGVDEESSVDNTEVVHIEEFPEFPVEFDDAFFAAPKAPNNTAPSGLDGAAMSGVNEYSQEEFSRFRRTVSTGDFLDVLWSERKPPQTRRLMYLEDDSLLGAGTPTFTPPDEEPEYEEPPAKLTWWRGYVRRCGLFIDMYWQYQWDEDLASWVDIAVSSPIPDEAIVILHAAILSK